MMSEEIKYPEQLNEFTEKNKYIKNGDDRYKKILKSMGYGDLSDFEKLTAVLQDIGVEFEMYKEDCVFTKQTIGHDIVIKSDTDTISFSFKLGDKFMSLS